MSAPAATWREPFAEAPPWAVGTCDQCGDYLSEDEGCSNVYGDFCDLCAAGTTWGVVF
jgi:hypothetical protein